MQPANESNLELLEQLLDGEMPDADAASLRQRMAQEPSLSEAFAQLRAERDLRRQMWRGLEPSDAEVTTLVSSVRSAVRKDEVWAKRNRALRYVSGLAACLALGFFFGRYVPTTEPMRDRNSGIIFNQPSNGTMEVMDAPRGNDGFKVLLTDNYGRVIAEQRFKTFDEAREFTEDLGRMQKRAQPQRVNDTVLIKGEF